MIFISSDHNAGICRLSLGGGGTLGRAGWLIRHNDTITVNVWPLQDERSGPKSSSIPSYEEI